MGKVVLVDKNDNKVGVMDKLEVHKDGGQLHRALSALLYRDRNGVKEVLMQKRGKNKPLWPFCWSNTCCTHPKKGESYKGCAVRRLKEEMGIDLDKDKLKELYRFEYQAKYNNKFSEQELDTVLIAEYDGEYELNPDEVVDAGWVKWNELVREIEDKGDDYTPWFKLIVKDERVKRYWGV